MNATEILNGSFSETGKEYGYDSVTAEFSGFREFKIKWRRSCGWAEFEVSDYVNDAPREVLNGLAETIFSRISRQTRKCYPKEMMEWITSDEFVKKKQPLYLMRARNITRSSAGEHIDLALSYQRLADLGLVNFDNDLVLRWTKQPNTKRIGYCSVLMKVVVISSVFDSPDIPALVSDYVLYHELIHLNKGFDPFGQRHGIDFRVLEHMHPQHEEASEWLKRLKLHI
ncbi:MAG: hypothetical protein LBE48_06115 [Methanomassiliicoccaceae archaeon]|jgi:hypothetical protein|nr:hypothetical protein [Methanomassiliicoccaceae archaeon]